jgi:hypothetical protein
MDFQLFLTYTTKGGSIQLYLGIGVERVMYQSGFYWEKGQGKLPMSYPMVRRQLTQIKQLG